MLDSDAEEHRGREVLVQQSNHRSGLRSAAARRQRLHQAVRRINGIENTANLITLKKQDIHKLWFHWEVLILFVYVVLQVININ